MNKLKQIFLNSFVVYLAMELAEEVLEEAIAIGISNFFIKGLSSLLVVTMAQSVKTAIKIAVKKLTYKEGNDKMNKLKTFFLGIWANKKTIGGTIASALMVVTGAGVIDISTLPELLICNFNITPIIYYVALGIFALIGVYGKGLEKIKTFFERVNLLKAQKETKAIRKEAEKKLKAQEKLANQTQIQKEKADAKAEKENQAKLEKEQAKAEHDAKVEQAMKELIAAKEKENQPTEVK